jgi:hypothetical protein
MAYSGVNNANPGLQHGVRTMNREHHEASAVRIPPPLNTPALTHVSRMTTIIRPRNKDGLGEF